MTMPYGRCYRLAAIVVFIFLTMVAVRDATAGNQKAVVVSFSGQAEYLDAGDQSHALSRGLFLTSGQAVVTGDDGYVLLSLDDGSRIEVFGNSRVMVNELWAEEESQGFSLSLLLGHIHLKLKKILAPDMVVTPTMVAGVRGTEFSATVADDGATVISVADGTVNVATPEDGDRFKSTDLIAGQEVELDEPGKTPEARSRKIDSPQAAQTFIKDRFRQMAPHLPEITARMNQGLEKGLKKLTGLTEAIEKKSAHIMALAQKLKSGRINRKQANDLRTELKREVGQFWLLGRAFKTGIARTRGQFGRLDRLARIRPRLDGQLPPEKLAELDRNLKQAMSQKDDFRAQTRSLFQRVSKAVEPIMEMMKQAKKSRPGPASKKQ